MFTVIISKICIVWFPIDSKLIFVHPINEPVKLRINGFGEFGLDCFVQKPIGSAIICANWSWWLRMTKIK